MRRPLPLLILLLLALSAEGATIQTMDGQTLQGTVQLDPTGIFLLWPSNAPPIPIALTNLSRADFSNPTNSPVPLSRSLRPLAMDEQRGALPEPWENTDVGERDHPGIHENVDALQQGIAGARKVLIMGVGHVVSLEKPEELRRIVLDFLGAD